MGKTALIQMLLGAVLALPGWSVRSVLDGTGRVLVIAVLTALLTAPLSLAAGLGRGYLAAVGALFAALYGVVEAVADRSHRWNQTGRGVAGRGAHADLSAINAFVAQETAIYRWRPSLRTV